MIPESIIKFCSENGGNRYECQKVDLDFSIWKADQIEELNESYKISEFLPNYVGFGSDGGNELLAYNCDSHDICHVPFIPMDEDEAVLICNGIEEFTKIINKI